jgi:hypothetical protein
MKMTRHEAIEKLQESGCSLSIVFVNALEVLGLLKFEEEKSMGEIIKDARMTAICYPDDNCQYEFIKYLNEHGYIIVKK